MKIDNLEIGVRGELLDIVVSRKPNAATDLAD